MSELAVETAARLPILMPEELADFEKEIGGLDPELLEHEETRKLLELGGQFCKLVTEKYGTPDEPECASGAHEKDVIMMYHNGGENGHTSVGPAGAGVPRNVLLIAQAVNAAADREVFEPLTRAEVFCAAAAHDIVQLCGRALLPEGELDIHRGDERLSAEMVRETYRAVGGGLEAAERMYDDVMATAFNPHTSAQNVNYARWRENPDEPELLGRVLRQELIAAADLLSPTSPRGPLGALEYTLESMCLEMKDKVLPERMRALGIDPHSAITTDQLLDIVAEDEALRAEFAKTAAGQSLFFSNRLKYSDQAIRYVCGGEGVDDLFPGRTNNVATLERFGRALEADDADPREIFRQARALAAAI